MPWTKVEDVASVELLTLYSVDGIACHRFAVQRLGARDADYFRYENVRSMLADWINDAREVNRQAFKKHTLDVWVGQRSERGRFLPQMEVILAARHPLPSDHLQRFLLRHPAYLETIRGIHPVAQGAFPELRVSGATIQQTWRLQRPFLTECSKWFRANHRLLVATHDPYKQMLDGADEPGDFDWKERRRRG